VNLTDKAALITGAKRIGLIIAVELARRGVDVGVSYSRSRAEADAAVERVRAEGRRAAAFATDLSRADSCTALVDDVARAFGRLDIVINMASIYVKRPFDALTVADWDAVLAIDLRAAFLCARAAAPHMRAHGGGHIINFSDWTARSGRPRYPGFVPYYVAKAGVIALTEALALELAPDNILVNAIAPGPITPPPDTTDEELKAVAAATPLGRWGGANAVAQTVIGLLESDFVTGETIRVDGGRHVR